MVTPRKSCRRCRLLFSFPPLTAANIPSTGVKKIVISSLEAPQTQNQLHFFHSWDGVASPWHFPSPRLTQHTLKGRMRLKRVHPICRISLGHAVYFQRNQSQWWVFFPPLSLRRARLISFELSGANWKRIDLTAAQALLWDLQELQ